MKKIIGLLGIIGIAHCYSQNIKFPVDSTTGLITYAKIIYFDSNSDSKELFNRAYEWMIFNYNSKYDQIQLKDTAQGRIAAQVQFIGFIKSTDVASDEVFVKHIITIKVQSDSCEIKINNLTYGYYVPDVEYETYTEGTFEGHINAYPIKNNWVKFFDDCDSGIYSLLNCFSDYMQMPVKSKARY